MTRPTPERLEEIRQTVEPCDDNGEPTPAPRGSCRELELLAEIDSLTRERDSAREIVACTERDLRAILEQPRHPAFYAGAIEGLLRSIASDRELAREVEEES